MTMKIIVPTVLTTTMLTSSTAPETDYAEWNAATSYTIGNRVIRATTHRVYENLIGGVDAANPESAPTRWLDIAPTNRWAMFDNKVGTVTSITSPLTVVANPGRIAGLALMELVGSQASVTLKDVPGGTVIYSATIELDGTIITSFYEWFFEERVQRTDWALTDLPDSYTSPELTISITTSTGNIECGVCKFGLVLVVGKTHYGAKASIVDFSRKEADAFGNYSITQRAFSKRNSLQLTTAKADFNKIFRALSALRATPAIYLATDLDGYEPLMIYGFYKDFSIHVAHPTAHLCNLEIEGLI